MGRDQWEYLEVVAECTVERREPSPTLGLGLTSPHEPTKKFDARAVAAAIEDFEGRRSWVYRIWKPGAKATQTRPKPDARGALDLMNELGREGWELVAVNSDRNRVTQEELQGWNNTRVSDPIRRQYWFKRRCNK